jgi:hypothetical protein
VHLYSKGNGLRKIQVASLRHDSAACCKPILFEYNPRCESPLQGKPAGFERPFDREPDSSSRWVVPVKLIPWDEIAGIYYLKSASDHQVSSKIKK